MENSKEFIKGKEEYTPRISFKENPKHTVTLISDKKTTINTDGGDVEGVEYTVKERGVKKTFFTGSPQLVGKLADFEPGETVTIKMLRQKGSDGNYYSTFEVTLEETEEDAQKTEKDTADPNSEMHRDSSTETQPHEESPQW